MAETQALKANGQDGATGMQIPTVELGSSGLKHQGGILYEEPLRELTGKRGIAAYREMSRNHPVIGAVLRTFRFLMRRVGWDVTEPEESYNIGSFTPAEFVKSCMDGMSHTWDDHISEVVAGILTYGWAYFELVARRRDDGLVGWRKLAPRAQETLDHWDLDETGGIKGLYQSDPYNRRPLVFLPIEKSLLFRLEVEKNSPEGTSLLRNAYPSYFRQKQIETVEAIAIDRNLNGIPVARVPSEILQDGAPANVVSLRDNIRDIVVNLRVDEQAGIMFPLAYDDKGNKLWELELLSPKNTTGGIDTDKVIRRYNQVIAMAMMNDLLLLGHEKVGSYSLGEMKSDIMMLALEAIIESIQHVHNRISIPRLFSWNGIEDRELPKLAHQPLKETDVKVLTEGLKDLASVGLIMHDEELESHLRKTLDLPDTADQSTITPPKAA